MEQRAHFITVATPDLDAARRFYVDGLHWSALLDVPGEIVFFQVGPGLMLGLFESQHFVEDLDRPADLVGHRAPAGLTLSHNVESPGDVRTVIDDAISAGATLVKAPQETSFGAFHGHFADPNGLIWEICHNPGWSVDQSGTVSLS
jgi:catechol 2,3-dioxygenase-like lactoylglutathione lyase family enzyme